MRKKINTLFQDGQAVLCADRDFKVPERMKKIFGGVTNGQNRYVAMDDFEAHVSTDLFQNVSLIRYVYLFLLKIVRKGLE